MKHQETRSTMERLADSYDEMADRHVGVLLGGRRGLQRGAIMADELVITMAISGARARE